MQIEATFLLRIRSVRRRTTNVAKIKINLIVLISSLNNNYFEDAYRYTLEIVFVMVFLCTIYSLSLLRNNSRRIQFRDANNGKAQNKLRPPY